MLAATNVQEANSTDMKKMTPSKEDYLRVMLDLSGDEGIHSSDIANALGLSRASVSRMMSVFKNEGYISMEKYGTVTLTEEGFRTAVSVRKRRNLLKLFLTDVLGVENAVADGDACRMEHAISPETVDKLDRQLKALSDCANRMVK